MIFGKCNRPNFHGHNYELIVKVTGEIDPISGYVVDMKVLADLIKEHIEEKFDHRNLNLDTEEFKTLNPTAENIARVIYDILRTKIEAKFDLGILSQHWRRLYFCSRWQSPPVRAGAWPNQRPR